jgi:transcriptional regulator with XRE-family HTH domain
MARSKVLETAGGLLRKWRQEADLSQAEAAKKIGASQSAWASWEAGNRGPDNHNSHQIELLTDGEIRARLWAVPRQTSVSHRRPSH